MKFKPGEPQTSVSPTAGPAGAGERVGAAAGLGCWRWVLVWVSTLLINAQGRAGLVGSLHPTSAAPYINRPIIPKNDLGTGWCVPAGVYWFPEWSVEH